jgi:hypothetical protein
MKWLKSQNLHVFSEACADVEEIDAFKALENPTHGRTISWFVQLIRNGLFGCHKLRAQQMLS